MKFCVVGDPMISSETLEVAVHEVFGPEHQVKRVDWRPKSQEVFYQLRSDVEKNGPEAGCPPEELFEQAVDVDVIITHHTPLNRRVIEQSGAKLVGVCRAGVENVDVKAAKEKGITVYKTIGRNTEAVSDFAVGLMLCELRNIARGHAALKEGTWRRKYSNSDFMGDMEGKTIGLIGFGEIGRAVTKKLGGFDVRILVYDPFADEDAVRKAGAEKMDLETLLRTSDFISVHARLSDATKGIIGREAFDLMKPTAYLINTARAGLIDEEALVEALEQKKIGGAALDVFWTEPMEKEHPLRAMDHVTLTPHLAGATNDTMKKTPYLLLREMKRCLEEKDESSRWIVKQV